MLGKVLHASFEERLVFGAGDVLGNVGATAFGVAHLAEDAAAGAGDAFDGEGALVGVEGFSHGGSAIELSVLGGDLAVGDEGVEGFLIGEEAAFAVGDGNGVEVANLTLRKPRGVGVGDAGSDVGGDVTCDGVVGESHILAEESGFDEGLEAIADTEDEALATLVEVRNRICDLRIT